jgi:DNA polymerase-3 subunit gamma/tau
MGNDAMVQKLMAIMDKEDRPHSFLLYGPSGTGKTTAARIIAHELGCPEKLNNGDINMDFVEINASDNRGIDTAREIISQMHYLPVNSDARIWVLDEIHMGTKDFQNALLKALEEPPDHVYFILCTTDPQKLIPTIRNRCSKFETELLDEDDLNNLINWVLECENKETFPKNIIDQIAYVANGCPREALIALDQIIDLDPEERNKALKAFKTQEAQIIDLCRGLIKRKPWPEIASILKDINEEPEKIRRSVLNYMMSVLLNSKKPDPQAMLVCACFTPSFFYTGKAGLVAACADIYSAD